jgi:hypothetical protein
VLAPGFIDPRFPGSSGLDSEQPGELLDGGFAQRLLTHVGALGCGYAEEAEQRGPACGRRCIVDLARGPATL